MGGCGYGGGGGGRGGGGTQGPGQGRPGPQQRRFLSPTLLPQRKPPQIRRSRPCVDLQRHWGCPAPKSEPKPRKAAELVRPRAEKTKRRHGPDQLAGASQPGATVTKHRCLADQPPPPRLQRPHGCPSHAARAGAAATVAVPREHPTSTTAGEWPRTCTRWPRRCVEMTAGFPSPRGPAPHAPLSCPRVTFFLLGKEGTVAPGLWAVDPDARPFLVQT